MIQQYCKLPLTRKNLLHQSIWMKTGIILLFVFSFKFSEAQISIIQNSNPQTISQLLAGSGVTISNYSVSCHTTGTGTFSNTGSNLGLTSGVVLTTGNINKIPGSANKIASTAQSLSGDTHLSTLTSGTIFDPCRLEFDIVPDGPLLRFNYVFASEEYPEWVCSNFNDVFGFFISGPNPGGGNYTNKNIATIPGTNLPVAINTINAGSPGANAGGGTCIGTNQSLAHSALYKNNLASPVNQYIIYDAQTHVLQANIAVVPCQTYRLKLAIADVADRVYDSGLFLEAHSFASNSISVSGASSLQYGGSSSAYEGCVNGVFTLALSQVQQTDVFVNLAISGTATNGTDYITIPSVVMIPAGQTSIQIPLTPLQDGLIESNENVPLAVLDPCNGIVSSSASITISDNIPATITVGDSALCLGQSTQLTAAGGVSYNWIPTTGLSNPNVNNPNATPTTTTTYTANMQFGSCTKIVSQTIYVSNPVVTINTNPTTGTICDGESVILTANSSAGAFPYNYLWSTGSVSSSITIATGGSYNVTSIDSYGCSASATRDFMISNLSISGVVTNVSFFGGNNGLVDITVSGSNTPFTYDWGGGIVSQDRINVTAGTYTVTASNTIGCSVTASYNVTQPASNLTTSATNTSVNCNGGDNGSINLTVNGGVTPYTFVWSNGATTEDLNLLIAGSYSVTVSDFNGSTATRTVTITQPTAIVTATTQTNVNCNGESTGSIKLSVSGAIGPYTFAWSNGASTQDLANLSAGSYVLTVTDANNCNNQLATTIVQPTALSTSVATTNVNCFGQSTGAINLTINGGTPNYNFNWGGVSTQNRTALAAGTYTVTVTDGNNCTTQQSATITQPAAALQAILSTTNVNCFNGNNGAITVNTIGGTAPYAYLWNDGYTNANRSTLSAGSYTLTVTDGTSCSFTSTATITQPAAALALSVSSSANISCFGGNNGAINLFVSGGTSPYSFVWNDNATTLDRTNLTAGNYSATVTDNNGCTASAAAILTQPNAPLATASVVTPVSCFSGNNGAINLTTTGGTAPYLFNWSNATTSEDITSLNQGNYQITITDANLCSLTSSYSITQPTALSLSETHTNVLCFGGNNAAINLTIIGGTTPYNFTWSNGATSEDITNLTVGNYIVTVNDANACSASISSTITEPTALMVSATSTHVSCFGGNNGSTNVTTSGGTTGYVFNWNNGVTTEDLNTIVAGSYTLTVTDNNNCTATRNVVITQPNLLSTTISSNNILCNSASTGTVDLMVNGGTIPYNYNWSNAATTEDLSTLSAGGYSVTVTDANNCSATNSTTLTQPSALVVSETHLDVLCNGAATGMIDITATGGTGNLSYNWSNGDNAQDISGVFAGNYTVTVSDANTCSVTQNITIQQPTSFIIGLQYNNVACNGGVDGNINLSISGGTPPYTFDWNNEANTEDLTNIAAGNYFVIINDVNNCVANANTTITQPNILSLTFTQTNLSCFNDNKGSIDINTEGGSFPFSYNWNDGTNTQDRNNLKAGTYDVTVTDANACQEVIQGIVITNPSEITVNLQITDIDCGSTNKGNILTQVIGGAGNYSFNWSNGSTANQITNQPTGSYSLTVADANGCTQSASGFINTLPQLQITSLIDQLVCVQDRGSIDVTVAGGTTPFNFSWNTGSTTEDLNNIQPGNYSLLVTDANGCTISETFNVINTNSFNVNTTGSATITMGETAILNAVTTGSNQTTYNWTPAINHTCPNCQSTTVQPGSTTLYTVIATDTNGCIAQDTVTVKVIADYNIFTPNAFTPNGDGNNDYLQIFGNLAGVKKLDLMIFNRWGEKVYETTDVNFQWDGRFKGDLIESSVLVYVMKIVHLDGYNQKVFKGSITILR